MSVPVKLSDPKISDSQISRWLRKNRLKRTQANITRATNALKAEKQFDSLPLGRDISVPDADAYRQVIYGIARVGGTITFIDARANNQFTDLIITLSGHEISAVQELYIDKARVVFQSGTSGWSKEFVLPDGTVIPAMNKLFMQPTLGADDQLAIGDLVALNPSKWTWEHRQRSCAHVYIQLVWDAYLFGDGLPDFSFLVHGKPVYDPRTETTYFTNLAALCAADYLRDTRIGAGVPDSRIDFDSLSEAATVCGEDVPLQGGGTEKRYTVNGYWTTQETHGRVLERMAAAMGGHITFTNGLWRFWPAKWREPTITLTEDDIRGPIRMQVLASREDIFNGVRGTFVSAAAKYVETDYPPVKNAYYATVNGEEIWENIDFNLVTSAPTCQRLAKIEIERIQQGIQLEFSASLKAYPLQAPENVNLSLERYGFTPKTFEVVRTNLSQSGSGDSTPEILVDLTLRETAAGVFNWDYWEETVGDVAPNTTLPSPFSVSPPVNLILLSGTDQLYQRLDGTVVPRVKLTWDALNDFFVTSGGHVEIQFKRSDSADWLTAPEMPGSTTTTFITDVQDGTHYDFRVRAVNAFGNVSDWTTIVYHFVVGKTALPSNVTVFNSVLYEDGILLGWNEIPDIDIDYYEIREGTSWESSTSIFKGRTTQLKLGTRAVGTYTFHIRAFDTSRNASVGTLSTSVTILPPIISSAQASIVGVNVVIDWEEAVVGSWAIDGYAISYGDVFASATPAAFVKASILTLKVEWLGLRRFWIQVRDVFGNLSTPIAVDVPVSPPNIVRSLAPLVSDNNVMLRWEAPLPSTLPIDHYVVRRGETYAGSEIIGIERGTFSVVFELTAGVYTYWAEAVDSAGNSGAAASTTTSVFEPPDYELVTDITFTAGDTLLNVIEDAGEIVGPINTTRTWAQHFEVHDWDTPQDQIDAGFPYFIQPVPAYGRWEKIHDLGTVLNNVLIHLSFNRRDIVPTVELTYKIAYSTDGTSWTEVENVYAVLAAAVRYIRTRLDLGTVP